MDKILAVYYANKLFKQTGEPQFVCLNDVDDSYFTCCESDYIRHPELETYEIIEVIE